MKKFVAVKHDKEYEDHVKWIWCFIVQYAALVTVVHLQIVGVSMLMYVYSYIMQSVIIAICTKACENGGTCTAPDNCSCVAGWTGPQCTNGINVWFTICYICLYVCVFI